MIAVDQRRGLVVVVLILVLSSVTYLTHLYTSQSSRSPVESSYLSNEQSFFDGKDASNYNPFECTCPQPNANNNNNNNNNAPTIQMEDISIPESLPPPPQDVMDKINNNLVQNRVLIVATANYGMRNHVYNWIESLKRTGESKFLIFCLDDKLYQHLKLAGYEQQATPIPDSWFHQQVEEGFELYYSKKYRVITHSKTLVVQQLLYQNVNVFFSDVDIVWTRPRMVEFVHTFFDIREETHVLFQTEGMDQKVINSGFYLMRSSDEMKRLLVKTIQIQDTDEAMTQQGAMNAALNMLNMDVRSGMVVLLDVLHFPNGFVYFDNDLPNKHGVQPFIVHANYLVGDDKKQKLKEHNLWYLDDAWLDQMDAKLEQEPVKKSGKKEKTEKKSN